MLNIASDEDFPEEEYTNCLLEGCDPTLKDIKWDKLNERELKKKKEECKENVAKLLEELDKKFRTGKHSDAEVMLATILDWTWLFTTDEERLDV